MSVVLEYVGSLINEFALARPPINFSRNVRNSPQSLRALLLGVVGREGGGVGGENVSNCIPSYGFWSLSQLASCQNLRTASFGYYRKFSDIIEIKYLT